jgi:retinol dehydrogenase-12
LELQRFKMGNQWSQAFPPAATFTEASLPNCLTFSERYIITGASAGVGKELARLLYSRNGTLYLAARSAPKVDEAISWIKAQHPDPKAL